MILKQLVALADEGPYCGTKPPGRPRHWPPIVESLRVAEPISVPWRSATEEPDPSPWQGEFRVSFWNSIRLYQAGERIELLKGAPSELGAQIVASANAFFDEQCGSVPISVAIAHLLHPPPSPSPWTERIIAAAANVELGVQLGGDMGKQLAGAAAAIIKTNLPQRQAGTK